MSLLSDEYIYASTKDAPARRTAGGDTHGSHQDSDRQRYAPVAEGAKHCSKLIAHTREAIQARSPAVAAKVSA